MDNYSNSDDNIPNLDETEQQQLLYKELIDFLTNNDDMKKAAKHSLKQGLFAGSGAMAGGILMGPVGGLLGGVIGSIIGFVQTPNYDGAIKQIIVLENTKRSILLDAVKASLLDAGATTRSFTSPEAFRGTLIELASHRTVRDEIWKACMEVIRE